MASRTFIILRLMLICWLWPGSVSAYDLQQQRDRFQETERLLEQGQHELFAIDKERLRDYPLYALLQYRWLQDKLWLQFDIETFLKDFADTRYADDLRAKWLRYLAANNQWPLVLKYHRADDDAAQQCLWRQAQYATGASSEALQGAIALWLVGHSQPQECDLLFLTLVNSPHLTPELKLRRFALALQEGNTSLAQAVKRQLNPIQQPAADFWLQVHQRPNLILDATQWYRPYPELGAIFAHGVARMADSDLETALSQWDLSKQRFTIDAPGADRVEKKFAMAMARQKDSRAYGRFSRIIGNDDAETREWTVRAALLEQNWRHVDAALQRLTPEEKAMPQWQYWQARAWQETGNMQQAAEAFKQLAQDRSFYGFLAADQAGLPYQLSEHAVPVTMAEIGALQAKRAFRIVEELRWLGRDNDAKRQWWYAVAQLDKPGRMLAAKLAQQWQWRSIAIFTLVKADYWDDLELRFPVLYSDEINFNAFRNGLDPALVYGLVRQESVFDPYAYSSAGARGLMQIMPGTGQYVAGKLNEGLGSAGNLFDPVTNLRYGTFYFKELLDRFSGNPALAAAGYNAGPQRVAKWRQGFRPVAADIWIETIPFKETRKYVSSVLTYSMIYQQRLRLGERKLKDMLRDVLPG